MIKAKDVNLAMVKQVAELLGPLLPRVVFLGGAATGLLITDEAAPEVRATPDSVSQARLPIITSRIEKIATLADSSYQ